MTVKFQLFVDRRPPATYRCVQITDDNMHEVAAMTGPPARIVDGVIEWECVMGWAGGRRWVRTPPGHWLCERPDGGWFARSPEEMERMFRAADG